MKRSKKIHKIIALMLVVGFLVGGLAMAAEETITGTVHKDSTGTIIIGTAHGQYLVEGQDLSTMVGKIVKVTGTLEQKGDQKAIKVMKMEEVKD